MVKHIIYSGLNTNMNKWADQKLLRQFYISILSIITEELSLKDVDLRSRVCSLHNRVTANELYLLL